MGGRVLENEVHGAKNAFSKISGGSFSRATASILVLDPRHFCLIFPIVALVSKIETSCRSCRSLPLVLKLRLSRCHRCSILLVTLRVTVLPGLSPPHFPSLH